MDDSLHFQNSAHKMNSVITEILKFISHKNVVKEWLTVMVHGPWGMANGLIDSS